MRAKRWIITGTVIKRWTQWRTTYGSSQNGKRDTALLDNVFRFFTAMASETERLLPSRQKARTDNELPKCTKSSTDAAEPNRTQPVTETELLNRAYDRAEIELPRKTASYTETSLPN